MRYPYITIGLIIVFVIYIVYLLAKKDRVTLRMMLLPGLFFIAVWALLYFLL